MSIFGIGGIINTLMNMRVDGKQKIINEGIIFISGSLGYEPH